MNITTRILAAWALAASLGLGAAAAQAQDAVRIGFVNTDRLFSEAQVAKAAQARLEREFSAREKQLAAQGSALKQAVEAFERDAPRLAQAQRAEREQKLVAQDADFQQKRRQFQEDLNIRKNEELQQLLDKANKIVAQVAKAENIGLVLQEAVYVSSQLDITDKVIQALNAATK